MRLKALPFHLIDTGTGVIIKRGCTEVSIEGENAVLVMRLLLERLSGGPASVPELADLFPPADREPIADLVVYLLERRLLVDAADGPAGADIAPEGRRDVFFWQFGLTPRRIAEQLKRQAIAVVGLNRITKSLVRTLIDESVDNIRILDYAPLRNLDSSDGEGCWPSALPAPRTFSSEETAAFFSGVGCVVAASDFGGWHLLERWNAPCVERDLHFLPVILDNLIGWIGPLVVPGRTACLTCLRARIDSNLPQPGLRRVIDASAEGGKDVEGGHPSIADLLGILAAMELLKFYNAIPGWQVGQVIEVNVMTTRMTPRRVLRAPRCPVCTSLNRRSALDPAFRAPLVTVAQEPER